MNNSALKDADIKVTLAAVGLHSFMWTNQHFFAVKIVRFSISAFELVPNHQ